MLKKKSCEHYGSAPRRATDFSYEYDVLQGISDVKKNQHSPKLFFREDTGTFGSENHRN